MNFLQAIVQEQTAFALVGLGLWSLALTFSMSYVTRHTHSSIAVRRSSWHAHMILGATGAVIVFVPSYGFMALALGIIAGGVLLVGLRSAVKNLDSHVA